MKYLFSSKVRISGEEWLRVVRVVRVVRQIFVIGPKYVTHTQFELCVCKSFSWGKVILPNHPHHPHHLLCETAKTKNQTDPARTKPRRSCSPLFNMPKGTKVRTTGVAVYWYECSCGYRWEGNTESAKFTAQRLHSKKCTLRPIYTLSHTEQRPIALHKESKTAAIDARLKELQEGTVGWDL